MERSNNQENQKAKINRIISYLLIIVSLFMLIYCVTQILSYIKLVNENASLSKDLEELKQDSNYLREHFSVLSDEECYSVYIDGDYQYVDGSTDSIEVIR